MRQTAAAVHVAKGGILPPAFSSLLPTHRAKVYPAGLLEMKWILTYPVSVNPMTRKQQAPAMKQQNTRWLLFSQKVNKDKTNTEPQALHRASQ